MFVRAPGRVNLIGDHTDYQDGWCLPMAIDRDIVVGFAPRSDAAIAVQSLDDGVVPADASEPPWMRTVAAVDSLLAARGRVPTGFDAAVASTIPIGSGLSSSAAFEVAITLAAATVAAFPIAGRALALVAQEVEHRASGVPCGVMDQMASVFGRAGHALLLDCRTLAIEPVPLPDDVAVVVVHSGLPRRLETSAYAQRHAACESAAAQLGVDTLRDATLEQVAGDPIARHVVSENARVRAFADALARSDVDQCGRLMLESHASLRDDFVVSTEPLDLLVDLAVHHGAYGARLTGAGFGGCVVALVPEPGVDAFATTVAREYVAATGVTPMAFSVHAADGAGPIT
jgi:galactokinase